MAFSILLTILVQVWIVIIVVCNTENTTTKPKFPAILVFGDSTVDPGNNNFVLTIFRANYYPYGKDFPGHNPTGRFSNGKLVTDFIASFLRIKDGVPPFLDPNLSNDEICTGVSFASAGSGYDDITSLVSRTIPFSTQIEYFKAYIVKLKRIVGVEEAMKIIGDALVVFSAGTNDFAINFYDIPIRRQLTIGQYQDFILQRIQNFVKDLYGLGCRSIVLGGLPPIGCLPIEMTAKLQYRQCLEYQNSDSKTYNQKLKNLLPRIQAQLPGSKVIYASVYEPLFDMMKQPQKYGFVETMRGCCGTGLLEAGPLCNPFTPICTNASQFLFWDSIHPSEVTYQYLSKALVDEILPQLQKEGKLGFIHSDK